MKEVLLKVESIHSALCEWKEASVRLAEMTKTGATVENVVSAMREIEGEYGVDELIFSALYLCSPKSLLGMRIPSGVRRALSDTIGINSGSSVSKRVRYVLFRYTRCRGFRLSCDECICHMRHLISKMRQK